MADNLKGVVDKIRDDVNAIKQVQGEKIKMPAGTDSKETIEYSMMDMLAGLCSAALFGESNKNAETVSNLFSQPDRSYLGRLLKHIESVTKGKDNSSSLKVSISSITSTNLNTLVKSVNDFLKKQDSNNTINGAANIILEINSKTDSIDKLNTFIQNLSQLGQVDKKLNAITILSDVINTINSLDKIDTDSQNAINTIYDNLCSGGDKSKLYQIIQSIVDLTNKSKGVNVDGFGEFIEGVVVFYHLIKKK